MTTPTKTIGRLSMYRRLLTSVLAEGTSHLFSHQLAARAGVTAAQVRRDLMAVGYSGSPIRGYDVAELAQSIANFLDAPQMQGVALVGIGNLGRAIMSYFTGRRPNLSIVAAFDVDPHKVNRVIQGCHCYPLDQLPEVVRRLEIRLGVVTVPAPQAQAVADTCVRAGITGFLNFAPVPLRVPPDVYVEEIDMTMSLEKVAFFARLSSQERQKSSQEGREALESADSQEIDSVEKDYVK